MIWKRPRENRTHPLKLSKNRCSVAESAHWVAKQCASVSGSLRRINLCHSEIGESFVEEIGIDLILDEVIDSPQKCINEHEEFTLPGHFHKSFQPSLFSVRVPGAELCSHSLNWYSRRNIKIQFTWNWVRKPLKPQSE